MIVVIFSADLSFFCRILLQSTFLSQVLVESPSSGGRISVKCWSNLHQVLVESPSSVGRITVKCWSNLRQVLVESPSSVGRISVKCWSNLRQVAVESPSSGGRIPSSGGDYTCGGGVMVFGIWDLRG